MSRSACNSSELCVVLLSIISPSILNSSSLFICSSSFILFSRIVTVSNNKLLAIDISFVVSDIFCLILFDSASREDNLFLCSRILFISNYSTLSGLSLTYLLNAS